MNSINFKNFIQVAGIIDQEEADMLLKHGVKFLGFPLRLPVNKEDLTEDEASEIISGLIPPNYGVIISYSSTAKEAIELCDKLCCKIIQLHGTISLKELKKLKITRPDITLIKSLVIRNNNENELIETIKEFDPFIDAYITDTYDPSTGASGATGKTHDWNISKRFVELSQKPVILAGGINHKNVYNAIKIVKPAGVDVHTGIEDQSGRKNEELVKTFMEQSFKALSEINT